jgi:hypothetical protein
MKYLREFIDFSEIDEIDDCDGYPDFEGHEDFCKFLVDKGVIDIYIKNFNKLSSYNDISEFLNSNVRDHYLSNSFTWMDTDEGYTFWRDINLEWIKNINEKD